MEVRVERKGSPPVTGWVVELTSAWICVSTVRGEHALLTIPWTDVTRILQRVPRRRIPMFAIVAGAIGALFLGTAGQYFDEFPRIGTPGHDPPTLVYVGIATGALFGGLLGYAFDLLRPKTRWVVIDHGDH